ncbi:aminotransferase class III-fold pyridoxal phosphate-dependent enzyme [Streptomyces werraensis]|uniref:aminotransferase class III-fold pyridoxal phosphate-dependent enzyme n=1 Tax=Streptomyces werraensis TaxID=68284 RepID=UPI001CE23FB9
MQRLCHEHDALFVLDEVQTGVGLTRTPRAYHQLGIEPDVVAFEAHVGGVMVMGVRSLADRFPSLGSSARGRGLMCACDLPSSTLRDTFVDVLREEAVLVLPGGALTVRLRPAVSVTQEELSHALDAFVRALTRCTDGA